MKEHRYDALSWRRAKLVAALATMDPAEWPEVTAPGFREEVFRRAGLPLTS